MSDKEQTFEKLIDLQHMMGAYRHRSLEQHGPMADSSRGKGRVLALLKMTDGIATKDMATVLGIRVSSLNETLARMEAQGFVERKPSEKDGRVMLVYLTEKGANERQPKTDFPGILFAGFSDEDLGQLNAYLTRMQEALEGELGEDWREHHERERRHREHIFHQARERGHGGHVPSGRGHGPGEREPCEHNCRACTRMVCVRNA